MIKRFLHQYSFYINLLIHFFVQSSEFSSPYHKITAYLVSFCDNKLKFLKKMGGLFDKT